MTKPWRITVRHGAPRQQYTVIDVDAASLADAMRLAADRMGDDVADADLVEIRVQRDPEEREFTPG